MIGLGVFLVSAWLEPGSGHGWQQEGTPAQQSEENKQEEAKETAGGDAANGKVVFDGTCAFCHIPDSNEPLIGPGLKDLFNWPPHKLSDGTEVSKITEEFVRKQITQGGGAMQPAGDDLSESDMGDLIAYLKTL
jgi:mono/diheme cytochrome c family protein